jgi:hypothetical protein
LLRSIDKRLFFGDTDAADCPQLPALVAKTADNFKIGEVSADKAYLSVEKRHTWRSPTVQ